MCAPERAMGTAVGLLLSATRMANVGLWYYPVYPNVEYACSNESALLRMAWYTIVIALGHSYEVL